MSDKKTCVAGVADFTGFRSYPCRNPAKYEGFCGVHAPGKRAERAAKRGPSKFERDCARREKYQSALDAVLSAARAAADSNTNHRQLVLRIALEEFDKVAQDAPQVYL